MDYFIGNWLVICMIIGCSSIVLGVGIISIAHESRFKRRRRSVKS